VCPRSLSSAWPTREDGHYLVEADDRYETVRRIVCGSTSCLPEDAWRGRALEINVRKKLFSLDQPWTPGAAGAFVEAVQRKLGPRHVELAATAVARSW